MKIEFSNIGSIKNTSLELKPLTLIIGPNNSNKTYIAYSTYGLLKSFRNALNFGFFDFAKIDLVQTTLLKQEREILSIPIDDEFCKKLQQFLQLQNVTSNFEKNLGEYFQDTSNRLFLKTKFEVDLSVEDIKKNLLRNEKIENWRYSKGELQIRIQDSMIKLIYLIKTSDDNSNVIIDRFQAEVYLMSFINNSIFSSPFLLPAERNSFVMTYKMLATRRYKMLRDSQRILMRQVKGSKRQLDILREQGDIRYPEPVEDFLDFLTDVETSTDDSTRNKVVSEYSLLADFIESRIQQRNKIKFRPTNLGGREIKVAVKRGLNIDLYNASSAIKQLTPLLLYLRYRARKNDLVIIDEPEMNLHPLSQVRFLEVLCILVNSGINVLITTHSPYFVAHLNNLVSADMLNQDILKAQGESLFLQDRRAFINANKISAYEVRRNKLVDLKNVDNSISWNSFSDISSEVQSKYFQITDKNSS